MKTKITLFIVSSIFSGLVVSTARAGGALLGSGFTYQGQLRENDLPMTGVVDLEFRLFYTDSGGTQVGGTQTYTDVSVVNGLFTAEPDFGVEVFDGNMLWLDVAVRNPAGFGDFTTLSPRQLITRTPYALQAQAASQATAAFRLDAPDGSPTHAVGVDNVGNVGIGTTSPTTKLHVNGDVGWGGTSTDLASSGQDGIGLYLEQRGSSSAKSKIRLQTSKSGDLANYSQFFIDPNAGFAFMSLGTGNGNVGIGTTAPAAKLDVRGDIKLGVSGQYFAPGGEENLRIVRGTITATGSIILGSGFTVSKGSAGYYTITFNTPFAGAPTVTATVEYNAAAGVDVMTDGVTANSAVFAVWVPAQQIFFDQAFHFIAIGPR